MQGLAGMAFDLPGNEAAMLLSNQAIQEAAATLGLVLDQPQSISLDVQGMIGSGGNGSRSGGGYGSRGGGYGGDRCVCACVRT